MAISLTSLTPNDRNPRTISKDAFKTLCESIKRDPEFMELRPIVVDESGVILGGNQRYKALRHLGMVNVPDSWVLRATGLSNEQRKRFVLVDNAPDGMAGEWDIDILAADYDIPELGDLGFEDILKDLDLSLDDGNEVEDAEPQIDKAEELRVKWCVEPGQLWELGDHRLLCGDSTKKEDVDRVMGGENASFCFTDPPYGVAYSGRGKSTSQQTIENDDLDPAELRKFLAACFRVMPLDPASNVFVCHTDQKRGIRPAFEDALQDANIRMLGTVIWVKKQASMGWQDFRAQHEPILFACTDGEGRVRVEDRTATTVWEIGRDASSSYLHPTTKPVELVANAIRLCCSAKAICYEPFSGSGTTIIACEQLGRKCRAIEISPAYVAVALQRWADATGKMPKLIE